MNRGRGWVSLAEPVYAIRRRSIEQAVEDVLEFHANLELRPLLDAEDAPESHALGGLTLPPKVVEVRSGLPERAEWRLHPRILIQHQGRRGIELAVRIDRKQWLTLNAVQERRAAAPQSWVVVKCAASHVV